MEEWHDSSVSDCINKMLPGKTAVACACCARPTKTAQLHQTKTCCMVPQPATAVEPNGTLNLWQINLKGCRHEPAAHYKWTGETAPTHKARTDTKQLESHITKREGVHPPQSQLSCNPMRGYKTAGRHDPPPAPTAAKLSEIRRGDSSTVTPAHTLLYMYI